MTSLHPTPTDPARPDPDAKRDGAPQTPAVRCAIAHAADAAGQFAGMPGGGARDDSVPRPRSSSDDADGGASSGAPVSVAPDKRTAARVEAALAERLRAARRQGRSLAELAAACRRPVAEVAALLGEVAPAESAPAWQVQDEPVTQLGRVQDEPVAQLGRVQDDPVAQLGRVHDDPVGQLGWVQDEPVAQAAHEQELRQPAAPTAAEQSVPVLRAAREEPRTLATRRPSPSRRLRRMHPDAAPTGREAAERETAAPEGALPRRSTRGTGRTAAAANGVAGVAAARQPVGGPVADPVETPLGILIGAGPHQPEAVGRPEERTPVRVTAEPVRIGRGTSLIVLPSWRPAIAVSVSTDQLLSATGLAFEQLAGVQLTVMINPGALHDRELDLHGWQTTRGRRGGRA
ncbi:hypothetical protein [Kitasatospora sp. NPDC093558]|uniref:hypothetical protein n=1 Tax=Kitasatospora sp. NPDC093558 TaxID=3155201 RepID=UPI003441978F